MKKYIVEIATDACLIGMAADLLYLYFAGGWTDPIFVILLAELITLIGIILLGIWRFYDFLKKI